MNVPNPGSKWDLSINSMKIIPCLLFRQCQNGIVVKMLSDLAELQQKIINFLLFSFFASYEALFEHVSTTNPLQKNWNDAALRQQQKKHPFDVIQVKQTLVHCLQILFLLSSGCRVISSILFSIKRCNLPFFHLIYPLHRVPSGHLSLSSLSLALFLCALRTSWINCHKTKKKWKQPPANKEKEKKAFKWKISTKLLWENVHTVAQSFVW